MNKTLRILYKNQNDSIMRYAEQQCPHINAIRFIFPAGALHTMSGIIDSFHKRINRNVYK